MLLVSVSVSAQTHTVISRENIEHGKIILPDQVVAKDSMVSVTCEPHDGYGLSKGLYYAVKQANGNYSGPTLAENHSTNPDDRGNKAQLFKFRMPNADVMVWATFVPLRTMVIHPTAGGTLEAEYGFQTSSKDTVLHNVAGFPIRLKCTPNKGYELLDLNVKNLDRSRCQKTSESVFTIYMPSENDTVHVTPIFGKEICAVTLKADTNIVKVNLTNTMPKSREEIGVTLLSDSRYIPVNFSVTGSKSWWRVGTPQRESDGRWKVEYRIKVDLQDITVSVGHLPVYSFTVNDMLKSGRVQTYIPEMIPDFPGVARSGQLVPVVFKMPNGFSASYTAKSGTGPLQPTIYHNALENSFADEGMKYWKESNSYIGKGLAMKTGTDSVGNSYWRTSVCNSMSQTVELSSRTFPASAKSGNNLKIAVIASINPRYAQKALVTVEASGEKISPSEWVVADLSKQEDGWQTVFTTGEVNAQASTLNYVVTGESDDQNKSNSFDGPVFDDLCLLLPTEADAIKDEDVLVFKVTDNDVTIDFSPTGGSESMVRVEQKEHATITLHNTATDERGDSVKAMKKDVIVIEGEYDGDSAIYGMQCHKLVPASNGARSAARPARSDDDDDDGSDGSDGDDGSDGSDGSDDGSDGSDTPIIPSTVYLDKYITLTPDSFDIAAHKVYYHYTVNDDYDATIIPEVDRLKIKITNNYGGTIEVNDTLVSKGDKVTVTVKPNPGCKLKQIRTIPADILKDELAGASLNDQISFTMPLSHLELIAEFSVPITKAEQFDSLSMQYGEFYLEGDLNLGKKWDKDVRLYGHFDGRNHRITYGGSKSLFYRVYNDASVRHLSVKANVKTKEPYLGGIAMYNSGTIEDCEVSGVVNNTQRPSAVGGVAGQNVPDEGRGGIISRCHVVCNSIGGPTAYGIAFQEAGATIRDNVFSGRFARRDGRVYMISNDELNSTIQDNRYVGNDANARAALGSGVTAAQPADLVDMVSDMTDYPVFAASIKAIYDGGYTVTLATSDSVRSVNLSTQKAAAGTTVSATVRVYGNLHLDSVTVAALDGSSPQGCAFTDNMDGSYAFSFVMPEYNVRVTFKTAEGQFIYTPQQFAAINDVNGTYFLARDIDLYNWERQVVLNGNFYGRGHTIRYHGEGECSGLFHRIRKGSLLEGLRVYGFVESTVDAGGIVLENQGTIRDCHFNGRVSKLTRKSKKKSKRADDYVAAIACVVNKKDGVIDHCSATGKLICASTQDVIDKNPLCCYQDDSNINGSHWIDSVYTNQYQELLNAANAARTDYPVYAQGILDKINPCVIVGRDTIYVENGATLDTLTLVDGQPFSCSADITVNHVVYQRKAMSSLEQWVLPFAFDRIAGDGSFEYHPTIKNHELPDILPGQTLTLSGTPSDIAYKANEPWLVKGEATEYVLTNNGGPITIKATGNNRIERYASLIDRGSFYATYQSIPGQTAKSNLLYVWDSAKQLFAFTGDTDTPADIKPFRFYAQFYNQTSKDFVKYGQTNWARNETSSARRSHATAPRHLASVMADGWQPVFLDPRQPQSVTARMLDYYEVAYLTDIRSEVVDEEADEPLSAVSLVYRMVDSRMDLPKALPLLVRAKRSDAEPLVNEKTGAEIDTLLTLSLIRMLLEDTEYEIADLSDFEMPHYWCASFGNRLDIWPLPSPERYADLSEYECMVFDDTYFDQSFRYADATDTRTTTPMSYCITMLDSDTYELLPLMGNRVSVEFIGSPNASEGGVTSVELPSAGGTEGDIYNLSGQRVDASYKGIILQNGRKTIKR